MTQLRTWLAVLVLMVVAAACGASIDAQAEETFDGPFLAEDPAVIMPVAAAAMGDVQSVRFEVLRTGAPVFIDPLESLALESLKGRFVVPSSADALLQLRIDGNLSTELGAIAIGEEAWLSNPITGRFEPLPPSYDIDPSEFFDPKGGWQPLLESMQDVQFVGVEQRDGTRYHLRGTAPADPIRVVTAGLVRNQEVEIDLWVHPVNGLVTAAAFDTVFDGETSSWELKLTEYGATFEIEPPDLDE